MRARSRRAARSTRVLARAHARAPVAQVMLSVLGIVAAKRENLKLLTIFTRTLGVFASCVYTSKKVFNFGLMFKPLPKLTLAATADSSGADSATVGVKHAGLAPNVVVGAKTTTDALHVVCVKKLGKDATVQLGATSKYADLGGKPALGLQFTLG